MSINEQHQAAEAAAVEAVRSEVSRYGDALLPGTAEAVSGLWKSLGKLPADRLAEEVAERLAGPSGQRYRNPEASDRALENGKPMSPLRAALALRLPELKSGALDALHDKWAAETGHLSPGKLAGEVVRRLGRRENHGHLASPPPLPGHEQRVVALADRFSDLIPYPGVLKLAEERGRDWDRVSDRQVVQEIARLLRTNGANRYGALRIDPTDVRLQPDRALDHNPPKFGTRPAAAASKPAQPAQPARDDAGRFQPAEPARRRPVSSF